MGLVDKTSIVKWNSSKSINIDETNQEVVISDTILKWINSLWIRDGYLWVAHNRYLSCFEVKKENSVPHSLPILTNS